MIAFKHPALPNPNTVRYMSRDTIRAGFKYADETSGTTLRDMKQSLWAYLHRAILVG